MEEFANWITANISTIASTLTIVGSVIGAFSWTEYRLTKHYDKKFEDSDKRFELLESRIFQLAMGKTLQEAMREEKIKG